MVAECQPHELIPCSIRSVPLARLLTQIAPELAARAGARLAAALGITIHRSTLLRLVMALPSPASVSRRKSSASMVSH